METLTVTIEIPAAGFVTLRNGVSASVDVSQLPGEVIARAFSLGLGTKVRNFSASALQNVRVRQAGAKRNDESDAAYAKRIERETVSAEDHAAEAQACIEAGIARLYAGEWGAEREARDGIDSDLMDFIIGRLAPAFEAQLDGYAKAKKVGERRALVNAWVDDKEGRREDWAEQFAKARAEAAKRAKVDLSSL